MPEQLETKPEEKQEIKAEEVKDEIKWPPLPQGPAVFYDSEKDQIWYGVPFEKVNNPIVLIAAIDNIKLLALNHLSNFTQKMIARENFKRSAMGVKTNGIMKDIFDKSKSFVGLGKA